MNFFDISDLNASDLLHILNSDFEENILDDKNIGLIFEKQSTRTRLSFQVGIHQLNGKTIDINFNNLNLSRYETFEDTFKAMNCYLDGLVYRTTSHQNLIEAAKHFDKPIINALSEKSHPCQIISDLFTLIEHFGDLNQTILWMGDMNNVCFSLVEAVNLFDDLSLIICCPGEINTEINWKMNSNIFVINSISEIDLSKVDCVMTDVFVSMNDEENDSKIELLKPYSVSSELMLKTNKKSIFMHCLPAKIGSEVSDEVFRSDKSIVWKQAYNRMIAQKKLLQFIYQK